jgi:hypothetical protein
MMRTLLILAAAAVALLAVLALTRGGPRHDMVEIAPPRPAPAAAPKAPDRAVQSTPAAEPAEPEPTGVDEDAAATGLTTREAAPADQPAEAPSEKRE